MNDYEVVSTYLNGCAGAAHPITGFEEISAPSPEDYIRSKHSKDADKFVKEILPSGQVVLTFDNGTVTYRYEFPQI